MLSLVFPTAEALDAFADTVLDLLYLLDDPFDVELTEGTPNGDGSNM